jgi:hypothetical protein
VSNRRGSTDGAPDSADKGATWFPTDDRGLGLVGLVIGVGFFFLVGAQATPSSALIPGSEHPVIQGTFYPRVVSVLIALCSSLLIAVESIHLRREGDADKWMLAKLPLRVAVGSVVLLASVGIAAVLLEPLGFILPSAVLATFLARWFGAPSWVKAALTGVSATVVVYLLFSLVFNSPLPPPASF